MAGLRFRNASIQAHAGLDGLAKANLSINNSSQDNSRAQSSVILCGLTIHGHVRGHVQHFRGEALGCQSRDIHLQLVRVCSQRELVHGHFLALLFLLSCRHDMTTRKLQLAIICRAVCPQLLCSRGTSSKQISLKGLTTWRAKRKSPKSCSSIRACLAWSAECGR